MFEICYTRVLISVMMTDETGRYSTETSAFDSWWTPLKMDLDVWFWDVSTNDKKLPPEIYSKLYT